MEGDFCVLKTENCTLTYACAFNVMCLWYLCQGVSCGVCTCVHVCVCVVCVHMCVCGVCVCVWCACVWCGVCVCVWCVCVCVYMYRCVW